MRWLKGFAGLLLLLLLGGGGYWYNTRVPRAVKEVEFGASGHDDAVLVLMQHADDPRVLVGAQSIRKEMWVGSCSAHALAALDAIYARQPLSGLEGAKAAVEIVNHCNHPNAKSWGAPTQSELSAATRDVLQTKFIGEGLDVVVAWLEAAKVPVSEDSMVAVAFAVGITPRATGYFKRGFPKDGAPLMSEPRVPVASDPRMVIAVREALLQFTRLTPSAAGIGPALTGITRLVKVPVTDPLIDAVLRFPADSRRELAQNLLRKSDVPRVQAYAQSFATWAQDSGVVADVIDALGAGSDADAEALLYPLEDRTDEAIETDKELAAVSLAVRVLVSMGPRGARVARKHLADPHPLVRRACIDVMWEADSPHFVEAIVAAPQKLSTSDMRRALTLAKDDPRREALQLLALGHPTLVGDVQPALLKLPARTLVPALFALIARRDSFSPDEVAGYRQLLARSPDSGPPTAQALDLALTTASSPEHVYWLAKVLALKHLKETGGGPAERAVVAKFTGDAGSYELVSISYDARTGKELSRSPTTFYFATLAKEALESMK